MLSRVPLLVPRINAGQTEIGAVLQHIERGNHAPHSPAMALHLPTGGELNERDCFTSPAARDDPQDPLPGFSKSPRHLHPPQKSPSLIPKDPTVKKQPIAVGTAQTPQKRKIQGGAILTRGGRGLQGHFRSAWRRSFCIFSETG